MQLTEVIEMRISYMVGCTCTPAADKRTCHDWYPITRKRKYPLPIRRLARPEEREPLGRVEQPGDRFSMRLEIRSAWDSGLTVQCTPCLAHPFIDSTASPYNLQNSQELPCETGKDHL
jgi:hypothetical protein